MSEQFPEQRNHIDHLQLNDQNGKLRKPQTQQSLNTKNLIKKMTAKKFDIQEKAQPKITAYMNLSNSTTIGNNQNLDGNNHSMNSQQQRIRDLQQRMKQRDLQIQNMKKSKEADESKFSKLYYQNRQFKKKSRQAIAKSLLEAAEYRRTERRQINPQLGYFKDGGRTYIQGTMIVSIKERIKEKQQMIKELEDQKKSKDVQKKQRAIFKSQFLQKEINGLQKQLDQMQNTVNLYKEQLKLADKQLNCQMAQKNWPIIFEQYQTLQLLGKGGFGQVYKCYDLQNNQTVAIKVNNFQGAQNKHQLQKFVTREAVANQKLNHPNIAKFFKLLECSQNKVIFVLQYCSGPELSNYLRKHTCLEQKQAKQIIRQILSALNYLSNLKQKIIHYDLKPSNIMFHYGLVKILDFGLCKPVSGQQSRIDLTSQGVGTYWYLPPEAFDEHCPQISMKLDIWSTGVIFYEMLYGKRPFGHGITQDKIYNQGIILNAKKVEFPAQTPKKYKVSDAAKNFIRQCLAYNPDERLSASEAYEHEYFKK